MTAAQLKAWRTKLAWPQLRASTELGITQACYSNMECGKQAISRRTALACLALQAGLTWAD